MHTSHASHTLQTSHASHTSRGNNPSQSSRSSRPRQHLRDEDIEEISKKMLQVLKAEARELSDTPSPAATQRAVTRLINDINELQSKARPPKKARFKLLKRIGRMLLAEAYRPVLLAEIGVGKLTKLVGYLGLGYAVITGDAMTGMTFAILSILGRRLQYHGKRQLNAINNPKTPSQTVIRVELR